MPPSRSERRSIWPAVALGVLLLLPVLYVASIGPALRLTLNGEISLYTYRDVYRPIRWIGRRSPAFHRSIEWWQNCWTPQWHLDLRDQPVPSIGFTLDA